MYESSSHLTAHIILFHYTPLYSDNFPSSQFHDIVVSIPPECMTQIFSHVTCAICPLTDIPHFDSSLSLRQSMIQFAFTFLQEYFSLVFPGFLLLHHVHTAPSSVSSLLSSRCWPVAASRPSPSHTNPGAGSTRVPLRH